MASPKIVIHLSVPPRVWLTLRAEVMSAITELAEKFGLVVRFPK